MLHRSQFENDEAFISALRDWFAGQALATLGTWMPMMAGTADLNSYAALNARAQWAYAQADAMLAVRKETTT